jgi:uncharacterized RDD family membrane protein YckC
MRQENIKAQTYELASKFIRALSAGLDFLINLCVVILVVFLLSKFEVLEGVSDLKPSFEYNLIITFVSFTIFLMLQGIFLFRYSQTIGKLATNIKIVGLNNRSISFLKLILLRYTAWYMISLVPLIGGLILLLGYLLIFTKDRRCLHDLMAGTKVVDLNSLTNKDRLRGAAT